MSETGTVPCGPNAFLCPECKCPLGSRWLMTAPSGCAACDEAITRHRCLTRPRRGDLETGQSWTCGDCLSVWTATEEEEPCGECGQPRMVKTWAYEKGSQAAAAPRYSPAVFAPLRNMIRRRDTGPCYRTAGGLMVHFKPGCRCR